MYFISNHSPQQDSPLPSHPLPRNSKFKTPVNTGIKKENHNLHQPCCSARFLFSNEPISIFAHHPCPNYRSRSLSRASLLSRLSKSVPHPLETPRVAEVDLAVQAVLDTHPAPLMKLRAISVHEPPQRRPYTVPQPELKHSGRLSPSSPDPVTRPALHAFNTRFFRSFREEEGV